MSLPPIVVSAFLALLVVVAAIYDVRLRRIPNWLTLGGVLIGLGLNGFLPETAGLIVSLKGLGIAFVVYFVLYLLHGMGAGDVKLMAAVGAFVGWPNWFGVMVLTAVFAAVAGLVLVGVKGRVRRTLGNLWLILVSLRHGQAPYTNHPDLDVKSDSAMRLPHGVMIACGSLAFLTAARIWAPR